MHAAAAPTRWVLVAVGSMVSLALALGLVFWRKRYLERSGALTARCFAAAPSDERRLQALVGEHALHRWPRQHALQVGAQMRPFARRSVAKLRVQRHSVKT